MSGLTVHECFFNSLLHLLLYIIIYYTYYYYIHAVSQSGTFLIPLQIIQRWVKNMNCFLWEEKGKLEKNAES